MFYVAYFGYIIFFKSPTENERALIDYYKSEEHKQLFGELQAPEDKNA